MYQGTLDLLNEYSDDDEVDTAAAAAAAADKETAAELR
jgi:hypothetical protein